MIDSCVVLHPPGAFTVSSHMAGCQPLGDLAGSFNMLKYMHDLRNIEL
jgi:hypothetical protein